MHGLVHGLIHRLTYPPYELPMTEERQKAPTLHQELGPFVVLDEFLYWDYEVGHQYSTLEFPRS